MVCCDREWASTFTVIQAIAGEKSAESIGRETDNTARLSMKAAMSKVTLAVCPIPVDFRRASNIATSPVVG
jgi:hypothetical protein